MAQQTQQWRPGNRETAWLSALVDTMQALSRPEYRAAPCDHGLQAAVRAHLAGSATSGVFSGRDQHSKPARS
jgi:hypothetical protein